MSSFWYHRAMNIFVATSYSTRVNYDTGEVLPEYKQWLETTLKSLEAYGHTIFCALRADKYKINDSNPAEAFKLDTERIKMSDGLIALLDDEVSVGVQTEIGYALALNKKVVLAHSPNHELRWFNKAIIQAGQASPSLHCH